MKNHIFQCCYTNASEESGGRVSSGWKAVFVSPEIPSDAYSTCLKLQGANSSLQGPTQDEFGNTLNLLEINGDGNYLYVIRSFYGLTDRLGRPNMFSHAIIFPCKDIEFIGDPNLYLTMAGQSFAKSEAELPRSTEDIVWDSNFELRETLIQCGLSYQTYTTLIQCVYSQISDKKSVEPIYIQYDGTEKQMMGLLYCIYSGLPFSIRRRLSVASVQTNNQVNKNLIFSICAKEKNLYIIPETGENNVLTARSERRLSRLLFVDYFTKKEATLHASRYFYELEQNAVKLGEISKLDEQILRFAHLMIVGVGDVNDEDLNIRLSELLHSESLDSHAAVDLVCKLLKEVMRRGLFLSEENDELLQKHSRDSGGILETALKEYRQYRFDSYSPEQAVCSLSEMPEPIFKEYQEQLRSSANGLAVLDGYYTQLLAGEDHCTWELLERVLQASDFMDASRPRTIAQISESAWNTFTAELYAAMSIHDDDRTVAAVKEYTSFMNESYLGLRRTEDFESKAKNEYWEKFSFADFSFDSFQLYAEMKNDSPKSKVIMRFCELPNFAKDDVLNYYQEVKSFFEEYSDCFIDFRRDDVRKVLFDQTLKVTKNENLPHFEQWGYIFMESPNGETLNVLRELYANIYFHEFDEAKIKDAIRRFIDLGDSNAFLKKNYFNKVTNTLILMLYSTERENSNLVIELDIWLELATEVYANCFELFETYGDLKIIEISPELVVNNSELIHKQEYIKAAEEYAAGRGKKKEFLNEWLKEVKRIPENLPQSEEEKQNGSENGALSSTQMQENNMENAEQRSEGNDEESILKTTEISSSKSGKTHNSDFGNFEDSAREERQYNSRARKGGGFKSMFEGIRKVIDRVKSTDTISGFRDILFGSDEDKDTGK